MIVTQRLSYKTIVFFLLIVCPLFAQTLEEVEICDEPNHHAHAVAAKIDQEVTRTLAQQLSELPNVRALNTGTIEQIVLRGLSGARNAVEQSGFIQQEQQWSGDHGLLISASGVQDIETLTGAQALLYTGGANYLRLSAPKPLKSNGIQQKITLGYVQNYAGLVQDYQINWRKDKYFIHFDAQARINDDYQVPQTSFRYLGLEYKLPNGRLYNTAAQNYQSQIHVHFLGDKQTVRWNTGFFHQRAGVFAFERFTTNNPGELDKPIYGVQSPYQSSWHAFTALRIQRPLFKNWQTDWNISVQWNQRREFEAARLAHQQRLLSYQDNFIASRWFGSKDKIEWGWWLQYQYNASSGAQALLPSYHLLDNALSISHAHLFTHNVQWKNAVRVDYQYLYALSTGRHTDLQRHFVNYSIASSLEMQWGKHQIDIHLQKIYRSPEVIELKANGLHHGTFRFEEGNDKLVPEEGVGAQADWTYVHRSWTLALSPYGYYYWNYIYLQPTGIFLPIPNTDQVYRYEQAPAIHAGAAATVNVKVLPFLNLIETIDYTYLFNLREQRSLPFVPTLRNQFTAKVELMNQLKQTFGFEIQYVFHAPQWSTARNESASRAGHLVNVDLSLRFPVKTTVMSFHLMTYNLFNARYYSATSNYKFLSLPEIGRNIHLQVQLRI